MKNFTQKGRVESKGKRHKGFAIFNKVFNQSSTSPKLVFNKCKGHHARKTKCKHERGKSANEERNQVLAQKLELPRSLAQVQPNLSSSGPITRTPKESQQFSLWVPKIIQGVWIGPKTRTYSKAEVRARKLEPSETPKTGQSTKFGSQVGIPSGKTLFSL